MSDFTTGGNRASEFAGALLLLACTVAALALANSPVADLYFGLRDRTITLGADPFFLTRTVKQVIDDGLMVVFFLLVGLEIKRELAVGELSTRTQAILPVAAAIGGVIAPALIYLVITAGTPAVRGWAIPVATDIAFAIGVIALLGRRLHPGVRLFLVSLAIVDDIFAVGIIAIAYGDHGVNALGLASVVVVLTLLVAANWRGARALEIYLLLGVALWIAVIASGLHATLAGVLLALCIPADTRPMSWESESPAETLEHRLHAFVTFGVVPLFALANAGVSFRESALAIVDWRIVAAVAIALVIGKPLGIMAGVRLSRELGAGANATAPLGVGLLGGIGFTMSLFIAGLSFEDIPSLVSAKIGILGGSLVAGVAGWALLYASTRPPRRPGRGATVIPFPDKRSPLPPPAI